MSRQVRRVAAGLFALFGALFLNLNYVQVLQAGELADHPRNARAIIREYEVQRGSILARSGEQPVEVARSVETDDALRFLRRYPQGELFGHVTGFSSLVYGDTEIEAIFDEQLGSGGRQRFVHSITDLLAGREETGDDVVSTIRTSVQRAAAAGLGGRKGSVVALDPRNGEILALWSSPPYDPNTLSSHDPDRIRAYWRQLEADPDDPLVNRAIRSLYPPGSTFKIVTAASALREGVSPDTTFPDPTEQPLPNTTATIGNFGGGTCNGGAPISFSQALTVSCNTTFAQLGLRIGDRALVEQARQFGLNRSWELQMPAVATSAIPPDLDPAEVAQSAIGQRDVRVTPLQVAVISGAIANGGRLMTPRIVKRVEDFGGGVVEKFPPEPLALDGDARAVSQDVAATLREMMTSVVTSGTATGAQLPGVTVAGKTGTAETGTNEPPTVWFTGFAPAEDARVAVAVVLEEGGGLGEAATGGAVAAPIGAQVIQAALAAEE
ncbi:MAG: penicillin-binding protein 2 [Actinobacteria bacterium]|nr:penicillin-binding protein 2 [Actinomycetota bacterium]